MQCWPRRRSSRWWSNPPRAARERAGLPAPVPAASGPHRHPGAAAGEERGRAPRHLAACGAAAPLRHRRPGEGSLRAPALAPGERCEREPAGTGGRRRDGESGRPPRGGAAVAPRIGGLPARLPAPGALRVRDLVRHGPRGAGGDLPRAPGHSAHRALVPGAVGGAGRPRTEDLHAAVRGRRGVRQRAGRAGPRAVGGVLPSGGAEAADRALRRSGRPAAPALEAARGGGSDPAGRRSDWHLRQRPGADRSEPGAVARGPGRPLEPHDPAALAHQLRTDPRVLPAHRRAGRPRWPTSEHDASSGPARDRRRANADRPHSPELPRPAGAPSAGCDLGGARTAVRRLLPRRTSDQSSGLGPRAEGPGDGAALRRGGGGAGRARRADLREPAQPHPAELRAEDAESIHHPAWSGGRRPRARRQAGDRLVFQVYLAEQLGRISHGELPEARLLQLRKEVLDFLTQGEALGPSAARLATGLLEDALGRLSVRSGPGTIPGEARRALDEVRTEPSGTLFGIAQLLPLLSALDALPPSAVDGPLFRSWQRLDRLVQLRPRLQSLGADTVQVAEDARALLLEGTQERTLALSTRFSPLAGAQLANFAGFLDEPLREFDYYAGVYDGLHAAAVFVCREQDPEERTRPAPVRMPSSWELDLTQIETQRCVGAAMGQNLDAARGWYLGEGIHAGGVARPGRARSLDWQQQPGGEGARARGVELARAAARSARPRVAGHRGVRAAVAEVAVHRARPRGAVHLGRHLRRLPLRPPGGGLQAAVAGDAVGGGGPTAVLAGDGPARPRPGRDHRAHLDRRLRGQPAEGRPLRPLRRRGLDPG